MSLCAAPKGAIPLACFYRPEARACCGSQLAGDTGTLVSLTCCHRWQASSYKTQQPLSSHKTQQPLGSHKTQQCLNTQCVYPAPPRVCYPKRKSPCMKQGFFTGQDRYKLLTPHRTCSARRSLKCPAVWVWPAFSFCRLCCCRLWPWRKSHPRLSHKMQPAQLLLIRLEQSWQHVPTATPSPSKHRQNTAFLMSLKTAEQPPENFPTQLVTRYRCD